MRTIIDRSDVAIGKVVVARNGDNLFHPPTCFEVFNCSHADCSRDDCCSFASAFINKRESEVLQCFAFKQTKCSTERTCDNCLLKAVLAHDLIVGTKNFLEQVRSSKFNASKRR